MVCPNRQELSDFALGKLGEGAIDTVAKHVDECPDCQKTITLLAPSEDTFLAKVKQVRKVPAEAAAEPGKKAASSSPTPPPVGKIDPLAAGSPAGTPTSLPTSGGRPMPLTCEAFAESVCQLGLAEVDEATEITNSVPTEKRTDAQAVAKIYIERGKLTKYQAAAIYQGKAGTLSYGDYLVLDRIGAGGMGQVFKARHRRMDRLVALKVMSTAAMNNADAVKRFEREVKAAAKLSHTNIVTAFDAGAQDGVHYLVMELVDGPDMSALLKKHGKLPVKNVVDFIAQAAKGLGFAHSKGVVHRDIKPGNLLVDSTGVVKILDMGLARLDQGGLSTAKTDHELTQSGAVMGTVDYMAPEQALNTRHADAKSDVYSLGCTLYRLTTGEPMYAGETMVEKILAHREQPVPSLRAKRPDAPPALDAIFQRMVAKKPDQRPSMQEIAETLGSLDTAAAGLSGLNLKGPSSSGIGLAGASGIGPAGAAGVSPPVAQEFNVAPPIAAPSFNPGLAPLAPPSFKNAGGEGQGVRGNAAKPKTKAGGPPKKKSNVMLLAAAAAAACIALGVWIYIKDKDGNTVASMQVPDGGSVTLIPPPAATPTATSTGTTAPQANNVDPNKFFALPTATGPQATGTAPSTTPAAPVTPPSPPPTVAAPVSPGSAVDLLALVQLPRDAHGGEWTRNGTSLIAKGKGASIQIPFAPTGPEYDLVFVLRRLTEDPSKGGIILGPMFDGRQFYWNVGRTSAGLGDGDSDSPPNFVGGLNVEVDKPMTVVSSVRNDVLSLSINGQTILEYRGPRAVLRTQSAGVQAPRGDQFYLGKSTDADVEVSAIRYVPFTGATTAPTPPAVASPQSAPVAPLPIAVAGPSPLDALQRDPASTMGFADSASVPPEVVYSFNGRQNTPDRPLSTPEHAVLSPDLLTFAVSSQNGHLRWYDVLTKQFRFQTQHGDVRLSKVLFSRDGKSLAAGGRTGSAGIWDVATGQLKCTTTNGNVIQAIAFTPDDRRLAVAIEHKVLFVHDAATGAELWKTSAHKAYIHGSDFSPDGRILATGSWDKTIRFWDAATGQPLSDYLGDYAGNVDAVQFSPDGRTLAAGGGTEVRLWDVAAKREIAAYKQLPSAVRSLSFDPSGRYLAVGTAGPKDGKGTAHLFQVEGLKELRNWSFQGFDTSVRFDPTGRYLGVCNDNGMLWILRLSGGSAPQVATAPSPPTAVGGLTPPSIPAAPPAQRKPVPDAATLAATTKLIKDIFKDDYADALKSPDKKSPLAHKLLQQVSQPGNEPAQLYALLDEAKKLAIDSADLLALRGAIEGLTREFELEPTQTFTDAWEEVLRKPRPTQTVKVLHDEAVSLFGPAVIEARLDDAKRYADFALNAARRMQDVTVTKQATDRNLALAARRTEWDAVKAAAEKLKDSPDDAAANLAVGRYRSLVEGDWTRGLPLLAKGSDPILKGLTEKSLTPAPDSAALATIGDAWWDAAQAAPATKKGEFYSGALHWYKQASVGAQGLSKTRIDKRIADSQAAIPEQKLPPTRLASLPQFASEAAPIVGDVPKVFDLGPPAVNPPPTQPAAPLAPTTNTRPVPAGFRLPPNSVPGLIGRITLTDANKNPAVDVGVLLTYAHGAYFGQEAIENLLGQASPGITTTNRITVQLAGVLHVPADMEVAFWHAGGSASGGHTYVYIDGKEVSHCGDDRTKNDGPRVQLARGEHAIGWKLVGGRISSCLLDIMDAKTGEPLYVYATADIVASARSVPTKQQVDITPTGKKLPPRPPTLPPPPATPSPPGVGSTFTPTGGTPSMPPVSPLVGGSSQRTFAQQLLAAGAEVSVIAPNFSEKKLTSIDQLPSGELEITTIAIETKSGGDRIDDAALQAFSGLTRLHGLSLVGTKITGPGLVHLKGLTGLTSLTIAGGPLTDAGLEHLSGLKKLSILSLVGTDVTDIGIAKLQSLTSLSDVHLDDTPIADASGFVFRNWPKLYRLTMDKTKFGDAGLEAISTLPKLEVLALRRTPVSDRCVPALSRMKTLHTLYLVGTNLSPTAVETLKNALPKAVRF